MPIFEYICKKCKKQFELLVYSGDIPECPACKSQELSKLISRVSLGAGTGSASSSGGKCSSCASGHCSHC
ncbi:MAG: zinc ribbon domain-containing protein [bacterium]|nr:zinc ribbon domain-containing protein [bacterium]